MHPKRWLLLSLLAIAVLLIVGCTETVEPAPSVPSGDVSGAGGQTDSTPESSEGAFSIPVPSVSSDETEPAFTDEPSESSSVEPSDSSDDSTESGFASGSESDGSDPSESEASFPFDYPAFRDPGEVRLEDIVISPIKEEGFALTREALTLTVGRTFPIRYEFTPLGVTNRALVWVSSDPEIAYVDENGNVFGVSPGTATITATTAKGRSGSCTVTVLEEGVISPLEDLLCEITAGDPLGWQFARYDLCRNGKALLIARRLQANGYPEITVWSVETGEALFAFTTGESEEWAVWSRPDGSEFVMLSFTERYDTGGKTAFVYEFSMGEDGALRMIQKLSRETLPDLSHRFTVDKDGVPTSCGSTEYTEYRNAYFASGTETPESGPDWLYASDVSELVQLLSGDPDPTE